MRSTSTRSSLVAFAGYEKRFVPLHVYLIDALDRTYAHLADGGTAAVAGRAGQPALRGS